ncbi:MAG: GH25 family lysozyme [Myxococcaceae bacterium]
MVCAVPREADALPPALDLEFGGNCRLDVTPSEVRRDVAVWLDAVERGVGKRPLVYATSEAYETFLAGTGLDQSVWIRDVMAEPSQPAGWAFWQFDCRARVPGIGVDVDLNVFRGDRAELHRL